MTNELKPSYYTTNEGGNWISWPKDLPINIDDLATTGVYKATVSGLLVHSIAFGQILAGVDHFIRWDCLNGFTNEPSDIIY